jgi:hypothetical protein
VSAPRLHTAALHGKQHSVERYCVGDVGGERGDLALESRSPAH